MLDNLIGQTLGPYQIVGLAGRGGRAAVYKAYQPALKRHVALKVLAAGQLREAGFMQRFRQDALAASKLRHPNLAAPYEAGQVGDLLYIAREYVEGDTLTHTPTPTRPRPTATPSGTPSFTSTPRAATAQVNLVATATARPGVHLILKRWALGNAAIRPTGRSRNPHNKRTPGRPRRAWTIAFRRAP
jgi:hypothetical protein